ncbi:hypothetical protein ES703_107117 [subsurface metagenome]
MWDYYFGTINTLKPQKGNHIELGGEANINENTDLTINLFHITLTDEIGYDSSIFSNTNFDPTQHDGIDVNLRSQISPLWTINAGFTFRDALFRSGNYNNKHIPEIPRQKLTLSNHFQLANKQAFNLDMVYTGKRYFGNDFANAGKQMPAHTLINLGYHRLFGDWKGLMVINNLLDRKTADSGFYNSFSPNPYFYYPLPERAISITIERNF